MSSTTPESKVKAQIKKLLNATDAWYFMPIPLYNRGIPDFIGVYRGQLFAVEAKAGKNKPTGLQELVLAKIRAAGGAGFVINETNLQELEQYLKGE